MKRRLQLMKKQLRLRLGDQWIYSRTKSIKDRKPRQRKDLRSKHQVKKKTESLEKIIRVLLESKHKHGPYFKNFGFAVHGEEMTRTVLENSEHGSINDLPTRIMCFF